MNIEHTILANLIENEPFARKVLPFLKDEYFHDPTDRTIFTLVSGYTTKYNKCPSKEALYIDLANVKDIDQSQIDTTASTITGLVIDEKSDLQWLVDRAESFCSEKAIHNALYKSIQIADGKDKKHDKNAIPKILTDALAVSFDSNVGHDFLNDSDQRFEYYHHQAHKIPFDLEWMNTITKGGVEDKTLNLIIGGTGVGKTLFLCHLAAAYMASGLNVLYITLEISQEKIAERVDANLLNISLDDLHIIGKEMYDQKIAKLKQRIPGKLIVKEYAATTVGTMHFRHLLDELKIKKNFVPDVIFVDSLNLCISSRFKSNQIADMYAHGKNVAEEVRGLAIEFEVPIWSAVQFNRTGYASSDPGIEHTGESFAIPQTTDLYLGLTTSDQLASLNQIMVTQLKNRYRDEKINRKFILGVDKDKMRLYNTEASAQEDITENKQKGDEIVLDKRGKNLEKLFKGLS